MTTWLICLVALLCAGVLARSVRLPPLVGFLAAGFLLNIAGVPEAPGLNTVADLGVTLLLFSIGLKLDARQLLARHVWVTAGLHLGLSTALAAAAMALLGVMGIALLAGQPVATLVLLGFAVSFSSTVFVIKVLEDRSQSQSLYGRTAIGILIWQDLAAVGFIVITADSPPSPWAAALLLLLFLARPLTWIWTRLGHGELQLLFGLVVALVPGYALFTAVGLKGDLGALAMGLLLAGRAPASELSRQLLSVKDLLLMGFFVSLGYTGQLSLQAVVAGLLLVLLIAPQSLLYVYLLRRLRLRHRTAGLAGLALANHSEFGLIVVAVGISAGMLEETWAVVLSVSVAVGFVLSAVVNSQADRVVSRLEASREQPDRSEIHPEDRPIDLSRASALVLGMGRVGSAAHDRLTRHHGLSVRGVESDVSRVRRLLARGLDTIEADATDEEFWRRVAEASQVEVAVLAMPFHGANLRALSSLRAAGFRGRVAAVAQYDDEAAAMREHGADVVLQIYDGAGAEAADRLIDHPQV